ncbi:MAG TPA: response regulator [Gemmatimonadaceae bacterium]|nr:response regulator [Gemmatimonadaceae bacterium]
MPAHVLIVEDSALVVGALRLLLEESGFRVTAAPGVQAALRAVRADPPDAMLLDLSLKDGSGLDVLGALTAAEAPGVTIAVTGHDDAATRERCLRAGCREVLVKPIDASSLPRRLRAWIGERAESS